VFYHTFCSDRSFEAGRCHVIAPLLNYRAGGQSVVSETPGSLGTLHVANIGSVTAILSRDGLPKKISYTHTANDKAERQRVISNGAAVSSSGQVYFNFAISIGFQYLRYSVLWQICQVSLIGNDWITIKIVIIQISHTVARGKACSGQKRLKTPFVNEFTVKSLLNFWPSWPSRLDSPSNFTSEF
jgi:hypothetical protein